MANEQQQTQPQVALLLPDTPILIANDKEEKILTMRELLPYSFGEDDLKK